MRGICSYNNFFNILLKHLMMSYLFRQCNIGGFNDLVVVRMESYG